MPRVEVQAGGTLWVLLIGTVIFLASFLAFVSMIPSEAYVPYKEYEQYYEDVAQDRFVASEVTFYNATETFNITQGTTEKTYGGQKIAIWLGLNLPLRGRNFKIMHVDFEILDLNLGHPMRTDPLSLEEVLKDDLFNENFYDEDLDMSVITWICDHLTIKIRIRASDSSSSLSQGWDDGELELELNYEVDFSAMGANIWTVLATVLTFQTIVTEITTLNILLNALITLPVWTSIGYILYRLIAGLIPTASGGGGA